MWLLAARLDNAGIDDWFLQAIYHVLERFRRYQEDYDSKTKEPSGESISGVRPVETENQPYDIKEEQIEYLELDESHLSNENSHGSSLNEEQPGTS